MSANESLPSGGTATGKIWPMALVLAAVLCAGYYLTRPRPAQNGGGQHGAVQNDPECERWTSLLNEAVGNLENNELPKADKAFSELAVRFPKEPAAVRNLAICRTLATTDAQMSVEDARRDAAQALPAIKAAGALEPRSPIPHILAARIAARHEDLQLAVTELSAASQLAPRDAGILYEIYNVASVAREDQPELRLKARNALAAALEADPENSSLLKQQLVVQTEARDIRSLETLKTLHQIIAPIIPSVKQQLRIDLDQVTTDLTAAIEEEKWPQALSKARLINNAIISDEWVKSDLRRLQPHTLSFVVLQLSSAACGEIAPVDEPRTAVRFQKVPSEQQFSPLADVRDVNLSDVDLDGRIDAIALTPNELTIFARTGSDSSWEKSIAVALRGPMQRLLVADLDRDSLLQPKRAGEPAQPIPDSGVAGKQTCQPGDVDAVVIGPGGVQVFRNEADNAGHRTFIPVEQGPELEGLRNVLAGVLADVDHDGDLDLVLSAESGISVWSNLGKLKFADISPRSSLPPRELAATSLVAVDWDRDLDIDILISGPGTSGAGWFENLRHGALRWRPFKKELSSLTGSACLNLLEADGNASWDVIGAGANGMNLARTKTSFPGTVEPLDLTLIARESVANSIVGDFDNDSWVDVISWGTAGLKCYWGSATRQFKPADSIFNPQPANTAVCGAADLDGDGDLDLVIADQAGLSLYDNDGGNANHWLAVRAQGKDSDKIGDVNHLAIGSLMELKTSQRYQANVVTGQVTPFGMGPHRSADVLRVVWTNGVPQSLVAPGADTSVCREHDPKGSCPYFYLWNGTRFEFCTDACWAAPLGLQLAEGKFAEPRAWEYLTIPSGRLQPKNGKYLVQMTEELWEATYLDRMELIVVDHPDDVEIFSNEKVGPPDLAEFKIHTVRNRHLPVAAHDKHGRDVMSQVAREDGIFMKGFDNDPRRGLADEHFLELDLGLVMKPRKLTLFLTGWLYPASTSLNVGVSQDPSAPIPQPPSLSVPDEHGNWQVVRPFMGFPGGKTKTIAVDLSDVFLTNDFRLRIVTNMEFFWDAAFFSIDGDDAPLSLTRLPVASADLHYRGFSATIRSSTNGPDTYDYALVSLSPKWAPMGGKFTRFGDVSELLQAEDDLQVIFGAGDELTVAFDAPPAPPRAGWRRDFLLHNVGWDKDNDLNVVTSQVVEPLPFHGMSGYPYRADEEYPDTQAHRDYLRKYQTRIQSPVQFWRQTQRFGANAR